MDEEVKKVMEEYQKQVKWLRERVPPDDIYDFAQQMLMAAENILAVFCEQANVQKLMDEDPLLNQWIQNVMSIGFMKKEGFQGVINTSWEVRKR